MPSKEAHAAESVALSICVGAANGLMIGMVFSIDGAIMWIIAGGLVGLVISPLVSGLLRDRPASEGLTHAGVPSILVGFILASALRHNPSPLAPGMAILVFLCLLLWVSRTTPRDTSGTAGGGPKPGACAKCGYDCSGLPGRVCPECGTAPKTAGITSGKRGE